MSTHRGTEIPEAIEVLRLEQRAESRRRPTHTSPIPIVKETPMCPWCKNPRDEGVHDSCKDEICQRPAALTRCPDGDPQCAACAGEEA